MNKYFLNPEKKLTQIRHVVFEKNAKNAHLIPKNGVTEPKFPKTIVSESPKLPFNLLTAFSLVIRVT